MLENDKITKIIPHKHCSNNFFDFCFEASFKKQLLNTLRIT